MAGRFHGAHRDDTYHNGFMTTTLDFWLGKKRKSDISIHKDLSDILYPHGRRSPLSFTIYDICQSKS